MFRQKALTKIISLFVVAFVCLNAGGAMCVAYCQSFEMSEGEHCPLKKSSEHCERQSEVHESIGAIGDELDCCPMTVSFFAAPVEKQSFSFDAATAVIPSTIVSTVFEFANPVFRDRGRTYRGPPLDRRGDRIKNCILRI